VVSTSTSLKLAGNTIEENKLLEIAELISKSPHISFDRSVSGSACDCPALSCSPLFIHLPLLFDFKGLFLLRPDVQSMWTGQG